MECPRNTDVAVSQKTVYKWFECFHGGPESTEDKQRSGHPLTAATNEKMLILNKMNPANKRLAIREISIALTFHLAQCNSH